MSTSLRTGSVSVSNESQENPLQLQIRTFLWEQDSAGSDNLTETNDISFFPRLTNIPPKEQRLIRTGIKDLPGEIEKAYRLFVEEIPDPTAIKQNQGNVISVAVRFGIPIFVKPLEEKLSGSIDEVKINKSKLTVTVKNSGNVHFRISKILATQGDSVLAEIPGWYLLAGKQKKYTFDLPPDSCKKANQVEIRVESDRLTLSHPLAIEKNNCF